jgi:transposase
MCGNPGRPTKLTLPLANRVVSALRDGASLGAAAERAGVSRSTLHAWLRRGRDEPHGALLARVDAARADRPVGRPWQEVAAQLEEEFPEHWTLPTVNELLADFADQS